MAFFLGIDGGGTKTSCLLGDESSILGRSTAPGCNIVRVGEAKARNALSEAIQQACAAAHVSPGQIQRTCVGIAGGAAPEAAAVVHRIGTECGLGQVEVVGDMVIALHAAFGGAPGVIVVAGTGSIAYGRNAKGKTARAGGYGFAISDEGSAHWIGRTAVSAVLRARDEGIEPPLLKRILEAWPCATPEQLVIAANQPQANFSRLSPVVNAAADSGDTLARTVIRRAGTELASLAAAVARRLFAAQDPVPVAMSGGVFANCPLVRETFHSSLQTQLAHAVITTEIVEPVLGALQLARQAAADR